MKDFGTVERYHKYWSFSFSLSREKPGVKPWSVISELPNRFNHSLGCSAIPQIRTSCTNFIFLATPVPSAGATGQADAHRLTQIIFISRPGETAARKVSLGRRDSEGSSQRLTLDSGFSFIFLINKAGAKFFWRGLHGLFFGFSGIDGYQFEKEIIPSGYEPTASSTMSSASRYFLRRSWKNNNTWCYRPANFL